MSAQEWPNQPRIFQINTWPWLRELSDRYERPITLADLETEMLPPELQYFDAVWLMGVWTRSPAGREIAHNLPSLHEECRRNL
ncbi:MAG TPA: alpha-amylase, partial [Candidatus Lokiarchaeia archaeon]|nr:alpha-amylase [Candidatus Lokiarchaeia archaeon]